MSRADFLEGEHRIDHGLDPPLPQPFGGSQQLIFNNEIIFPIVPALGVKGVLFCDAGNAFLASEGISFSGMRVSVGAGIRWLSPIGPLRIEVGFPLNAQTGDQIQRIQFSFGGPP